jgi:hypothetical protein
MFFKELVRLVCSMVEISSFVMLSFSLYRIPLRNQFSKIAFISFMMSALSLFQRDVIHLDDYVLPTHIISFVIFIVFLTRFTLPYAFLISISGYASYTVVQGLLIVVGQALRITSMQELQQSLLHGSILQLVTAAIMFCIVYWLQTNKYGFMLNPKRVRWKEAATGFNVILSLTLVITLVLLEVTLIAFRENLSIIRILLVLTIILLVALYIVYRKNKSDIRFKMERMKRS